MGIGLRTMVSWTRDMHEHPELLTDDDKRFLAVTRVGILRDMATHDGYKVDPRWKGWMVNSATIPHDEVERLAIDELNENFENFEDEEGLRPEEEAEVFEKAK